MKNKRFMGILAAPLLMVALTLPAYADTAPTTCKDGTTSTATGKGACSSHGGVQADTPPAGATAKCKDGTYSMSKTHSGACSTHGGVASWIPAK
jgi:Protein of unknown function (DUF3761)